MTDIPDPGRQAAHIILDAVVAYEPGLPGDVGTDSMNLALERFNRVGAVSATMDEDDHLTLDISNLAGGLIVATNWLVHRLAEARGTSPELVISDLRNFLDD